MPETPAVTPDPTLPTEPTPSSSPGDPQPPQSTRPVPQSPSVTPDQPAPIAPAPKPGHKKWALLMVLLIIVVAAVVAGAVLLRHHTAKAVAVKKDISILRIGSSDGGEVPQYPTTYLYVNNDLYIAMQLFEGLVGYQNQTKVVPLLATSWSNPANNTDAWIFNLRQGVKFHSGRTMTAEDVKYTLDYAVAHQDDDNDNSAFYFLANDIKSVTVDSTYQVTITTNSPDAVLLNQLGLIGIVDSKAKLGDYDAGTGPYIVKPGTTPTSSFIDLVAFDGYWGGHVYTREVTYNLYTNSDQLAADTADGKIDLGGPFTDSQLGKIKSFQTLNIPEQGLQYLSINTERSGSPLKSVAARQAVAYALNIPAIVKAGGQTGQQTNQIVPEILPGHNPAIQNTPYDLAKAKQLLASAPNASASITFGYPAGLGDIPTEIIKELAAAGFNITPVEVSNFGTFITAANAGQYDIYTAADTSATVDGLDILTDLLIGNSNYSNSQIGSLISQAGATLDAAQRISDMQQVATIVNTEKPIIPLYIPNEVYSLTKPYVISPNLPDLETSAYLWQAYQE
jgi:peptide/nickel transport system substrate-binding protein